MLAVVASRRRPREILLVQLAPFFREEWPIIRIPTCKIYTSVIGGVKVLQ